MNITENLNLLLRAVLETYWQYSPLLGVTLKMHLSSVIFTQKGCLPAPKSHCNDSQTILLWHRIITDAHFAISSSASLLWSFYKMGSLTDFTVLSSLLHQRWKYFHISIVLTKGKLNKKHTTDFAHEFAYTCIYLRLHQDLRVNNFLVHGGLTVFSSLKSYTKRPIYWWIGFRNILAKMSNKRSIINI